jgi:membrane protein insertase Oxa1/YidC/SpoIIIJ
LRRPFEPWKVRAWQRHQRLRPTGEASPAWMLLWTMSLMVLTRTLRLVMLPTMVMVGS